MNEERGAYAPLFLLTDDIMRYGDYQMISNSYITFPKIKENY
jgi:hypothetical protein